MEYPAGKVLEINFHTEPLGVWGMGDEYYGMGLIAKVIGMNGPLIKAQVVAHGFFGAWDSPDTAVRGQPVYIMLDPSKAHIEDRDDVIRMEFGHA